MTKNSDNSANNQSEAKISLAYNRNCHLSLMTRFVKRPPGESRVLLSSYLSFLGLIIVVLWEEVGEDVATAASDVYQRSFLT